VLKVPLNNSKPNQTSVCVCVCVCVQCWSWPDWHIHSDWSTAAAHSARDHHRHIWNDSGDERLPVQHDSDWGQPGWWLQHCYLLIAYLSCYNLGLKCNFKVVVMATIPLEICGLLSVLQWVPCISCQAVILTKFRLTSSLVMDNLSGLETCVPWKNCSLRPGNARLQKWWAWSSCAFLPTNPWLQLSLSLSLSVSVSLTLSLWSYRSCKAPIKSSPSTNQHPLFYRPDALPVAQPTVSKHWSEK